MRGWPAPRIRRVAALALLLAAIPAGGCDRGPLFRPHVAIPPLPGDASPALTLRSLEWSWNRKSTDAYRTLFTEDFEFVCSALDPASTPWTREDELVFAKHLFASGTATEPPAARISLMLDRVFIVEADPRPGNNARGRKLVRSSFVVRVSTGQAEWTATGFATFYLVRGDMALVPPEILPLGYAADSSHWYIDRWEDDTSTSGGGRAMPVTSGSICQLKALYR